MKIIGTTYEDFFNATKAAYEAISGNHVQRDALIRKLLNLQFFPNQNIGENEHRIPSLFEDNHEERNTVQLPTQANTVLIDYYDYDDNDNFTLSHSNSYVCMTTEATNKKLLQLFINHYPENADGSKIIDHQMVTDKIEEMAWEQANEDDDEYKSIKSKIESEIEEMSVSEACDWLTDSFSIDDLIRDDFFGDFLHNDFHKIRYENCEIFY